MTSLRYPIGPFRREGALSADARRERLAAIATLPGELDAAVAGLDDARLDTPYRPGGWTVRQVVHHLADSHLNAYVRTMLALTESNPTIRPYDQEAWAETEFAKRGPLTPSRRVLSGLHERWSAVLGGLEPAAFARPFVHPEMGSLVVDDLVALYAWHGRHHVAHVTELARRSGWDA